MKGFHREIVGSGSVLLSIGENVRISAAPQIDARLTRPDFEMATMFNQIGGRDEYELWFKPAAEGRSSMIQPEIDYKGEKLLIRFMVQPAFVNDGHNLYVLSWTMLGS